MNIYLSSFFLPGEKGEFKALDTGGHTCYNNFYPFKILPPELQLIEFSPITILYGGNGSGKSTILNVIAEKLQIRRKTKYNKSRFFGQYVDACSYEMCDEPEVLRIITSDDVFKRLFNTREQSEQIDNKREEMLELHFRYANRDNGAPGQIRELVGEGSWLENYDKLNAVREARKRGTTASSFAKRTVGDSIIGKSNGEEAMEYFSDEIKDPGIYLLDEPENSLSAIYQRQLSEFLFEAARFFGAQLIIATHSPFMLSIPGAKIYNLDTQPVSVTSDWTSLDNMREYYALFKAFSEDFER